MNKKNILFVVDAPNWAFGTIANNIASGLRKSEYNVEIIYTQKIESYHDFILAVSKLRAKPDLIHFFWRDYLNEVIAYLKQHPKKYMDTFENCALTTHVPDHLYTELSDEIEARVELFNIIDNYFVSSSKIEKIYNKLPFYPAPHSVIFDNPELPKPSKLNLTESKIPSIGWIGNSKWGEHLGYKDYKGLKEIITPAIEKLREKEIPFTVKIFDKAEKNTPRDEILSHLENIDILLISSVEEGTPLPLLEGISRGCAIISTDVGIVREILPEEQLEYVLPRTSESFYNALLSLLTNTEKLNKIKNINLKTYEENFLNSFNTVNKWQEFIENSIKESNKNLRSNLFKTKKTKIKALQNSVISHSYRLGKKLEIIDILKQSRFVRTYYQKSLSNSDDIEYKLFTSRYEKAIIGKEYITLYSPRWHGVANSTRSIFPESAIAFPLFSREYPEVTDHQFLDRIVQLITESRELKAIIISGGVELHRTLVRKVKEKRKDINIYLAWHGSPAQWVDISHYHTFEKWAELIKKNELNGVISFKPDLCETIEKMGIPSFPIKNIIPNKNLIKKRNINRKVNIGVFAALFSWYKNPFVQLMSTIGVKNSVIHTNLNVRDSFSLIAEKIDLNIVDSSMSNEKFVSLLNDMDLVLYITNTECSPMIALESCSVGTPCLVGPAGNIYKGNDFLEKHLVVNEVDNPTAINKRIRDTIENYDLIISELEIFVEKYNKKVLIEKENLIKNILEKK
ncbi:glycosyltransferase [Motilimonas cestriensis]|uniref:Glycosyltransferase n=1 Tax=Motilimonas cestriensis TaxID=2742685 RepID=A0ABS8W6Q9_9GAMM|nr:glycosyltransferase [Motilimonas cestriensis]MCE2594047.1 glycosyltransferase [Motilimonas cestriensis]